MVFGFLGAARRWVCSHKKIVAAVTVAGVAAGAYFIGKRVVAEAERLTKELQMQILEQQRCVSFCSPGSRPAPPVSAPH